MRAKGRLFHWDSFHYYCYWNYNFMLLVYCFKKIGKGAKNPKKSQEVDFYSNTTLNISHKSSCQATLNKVQINVSKTRRCLVRFQVSVCTQNWKTQEVSKNLARYPEHLFVWSSPCQFLATESKTLELYAGAPPFFAGIYYLIYNLNECAA